MKKKGNEDGTWIYLLKTLTIVIFMAFFFISISNIFESSDDICVKKGYLTGDYKGENIFYGRYLVCYGYNETKVICKEGEKECN